MSDPLLKEEERPESPPLGLLDPSRIQNPLASAEQHQQQMQMQQNAPPHSQPSEFVMPEQPRQQQQMPQQAPWQRTPTMSPANVFQQGAGTPGSQRSSTGTPNHQMAQQQPQFFHGESPAHSQGTPMTPQSGAAPGSACGTPQSAGPPGSAPPHPNQPPYDYQAVQMQQQQQAQAMAAAQQQHHQQQQQQFPGQPPQMMDSPYRQHPQMMGMHPHPGAHQFPPGYHPQWQQQMYARQQAQAVQQQRVVQQRIPYPPGAYPAGMPGGPQAPMTPGYPPPSPATRTTPGSAGAATGPPGTPQRPQYPPGQNPQQPPPQFAYPPPQQVTPTGQFPAGTPTFNSPAAHQMYRQGSVPGGVPNQVPPGAMRQYISPQAQQQPAPGTPHRFAPQTPSGTTSSPHFPQVGGPDLRSPTNTMMSPQQVMQQGAGGPSQQHTPHTPVLPRALHAEMPPSHQMRPMALASQGPPPNVVPQPLGTPQPPLSSSSMGGQQFQFRPGPMPPQQQPGMPMHHDPNTFPMAAQPVNTDPELFLAGCSIHCFDVDRLIQDRLDRHNLEFIVKYHGGEIEFDETKFAEQKNKITHVLIDSCRNPNVRRSLEERKRVISMQWLVDVLERQKTEIPFKLAHLPSPFSDGFRPYLGKLFSLSGFDETERPTIAFMAEAMGAKITPFLARDNDLLIAKSPSEKVKKAQEWKVPVVNFQWIADSYVVSTLQPHDRPNVENPRYQLGQPTSDIIVQPSVIESASVEFGAMLRCWKLPVIIDEASYERAQLTRKNLQSDSSQFPNQRFFHQEPAPTEDEIKHSIQLLEQKTNKKPTPQVCVYFGEHCGLADTTLDTLKKKVEFLGGKCSDKVEKATHVVLASGRRTTTLLEAICRGKNVMQPEWIVDCYRHRMWLDTFDYFLSDKKLENELSYNCKRSVLRARRHRVFEDIEFHVTRFVEPSQSEIVRLIETAGGIVHPDAPEPKYLARCIESEQPFIIVSCENDVRSLGYLAESKLPIYNVDLVLFAMLRQHIEPLPQYRIPISIVMKNQVFRQPPPYSAPVAAAAGQ